MKKTRSTSWSNRKGLCALGLIFFLLASCTQKPPTIPAGQVGTLGVATATFPPRINLEEITEGKGEGAAKTATSMTLRTLSEGGSSGEGACLAILLAPVMCIGGGVYGAIAAKPAKEVRKQREFLERRIPALPFQRHLTDNLGKALKLALVNVSQEAVAGPAAPVAEVDYRTSRNVDAVLEAAVTDVRLLNRRPTKNKKISFEVRLRLRIYRTSDNALLLERSVRGRTREMRLSAWAGEGSALEEELLRLIDNMAAKVVKETFTSSGEKAGTVGGELGNGKGGDPDRTPASSVGQNAGLGTLIHPTPFR